jgi:PAS domain S-box-containing protein
VTTFANRRAAEMLGYTVDEMLGMSVLDFMDENGREIAKQSLEQRRQGVAAQFDFKYRRKDGSELWALIKTQPMFDGAGNYIGAFAMLSDITERRRLEQGLRDREALLAAQLRAVALTNTREALPAPVALRPEMSRLNARIERAAQRFALLADVNRLRLVQELASGDERTVSELKEALGVSQSTASKHLKALADAGLLQRRRGGAAVYYCLVDPTVPTLCFIVSQWLEVQARAEMQALAG